ncbi:hypothetical protein [Telluribacter sp. SYSU D00476]|uniref:hypothetical protein n=1 Tax=Telluribacter sp. SYSU D00476 TaxID=2811430 RepID=UPI001FF6DF09|nr:hypothetical protein [Telluribacter sp. SYSU D00476]
MKRLYYLLWLGLFFAASCTRQDKDVFPRDSTYFLGAWEVSNKVNVESSGSFRAILTFLENETFTTNLNTDTGPLTYKWSYDESNQELTLKDEAYQVVLMEKNQFSIRSSYSGNVLSYIRK